MRVPGNSRNRTVGLFSPGPVRIRTWAPLVLADPLRTPNGSYGVGTGLIVAIVLIPSLTR